MEQIAQSHVDGNIPDAGSFDRLLRRDLETYFDSQLQQKVRVEYRLLRKEPTQTGISYPKYYLWAKAFRGTDPVAEGAVRVAAINKVRFAVTDFLFRKAIRSDPSSVQAVFPAALEDTILHLAEIK